MSNGVGNSLFIPQPTRPADGSLWTFQNGAWQPVDGSQTYVTLATAQTIAGAKTFSAAVTLSVPLASTSGGTGVNNAGTITNASNTTITGGGTLALGGFTLTVPATGSAGLLGIANIWGQDNEFDSRVGFGGPVNSQAVATFGQSNPLTGTAQVAQLVNLTANTNATAALRGVQMAIATAASAFTCAEATSFSTGTIVKGAGSTITRAYSLRVYSPTVAASCNITIAGDADITETGNWFIYDKGGYDSRMAGLCVVSPTLGLGYATGAGGTVSQATSKSTGVTLNKVCGQITMNNAALGSTAKVSFVVTNSACAATDGPRAWVVSGGTANAYRASVTAVAAGSFTITVENITGGSLSESPVIGFDIGKAVTA